MTKFERHLKVLKAMFTQSTYDYWQAEQDALKFAISELEKKLNKINIKKMESL